MSTVTPKSRKSHTDHWESGEFGMEEAFVKVTGAAEAAKIDGALELKMISIRLQNDLINKLKLIAKHNGVGYQSLIRSQLNHFARNEIMQIAADLKNSEQIESAASKIVQKSA